MMKEYKISLRSLLGDEYAETLIRSAVYCKGFAENEVRKLTDKRISVCSVAWQNRMNRMLADVGRQVLPAAPFINFAGAPTDAFGKAAHNAAAPVGAVGPYRLGEDGRLYLAAKSEHYHAPLGHGFPAYKIVEFAERLGVTNAAHNNTRGYITRLLERELIRSANGVTEDKTDEILASRDKHVLNRVINLETGSLSCEAAIKMMLMRFYRLDETYAAPEYENRIPVFFVMADRSGRNTANYHGTTVLTQTFRGMWPELYEKLDKSEIYKVVPVMINDLDDFRTKLEKFDSGKYKVAGFIHEIVLMNYAGLRLEEEYLKKAYEICDAHDIPTMCDEIQSCMWYDGMFLFRHYDIRPDFVIIGKGFPGGRYAASRILTTYPMDKLNLFGALVTNGQQELASLSYLITMDFAEKESEHIRFISNRYETGFGKLSKKYCDIVNRAEGKGLLSTLVFNDVETAVALAKKMNGRCVDVSVQTYKADCPTAALTKPPLICTKKILDYILNALDDALKEIQAEKQLGKDLY